MDNIYKAQDYIREFVSKTILPTYSFNDWKESLVLYRNNKQIELKKKWDIFGETFVPAVVDPEIISGDEWGPALMLIYRWQVKKSKIPVRFTIRVNRIDELEICDAFKVEEIFGKKFNFVNEFEKNIVLIHHLKS